MARKGRNIYKRKDGRWEGRVILGYDGNKKRKYHSIYGRNYTEVKGKMQKYIEKYDCAFNENSLLKECSLILKMISKIMY